MPRIAEEPFVPVSRGRALAQVVATALAYYLVGRFALGLSMPTDPGPAPSKPGPQPEPVPANAFVPAE